MLSVSRFAGLILTATVAVTACGTSSDDGDSGSQDLSAPGGNAFESGDCKVQSKITGKALSHDDIAKLGDPIAKLVLLQGGGIGCPETFSGIQEKLRTTDATKCLPSPSGKHPGLSTRFVSDRAQLLGKPDTAPNYRGVVTRACSGRSDHELFISAFGVSATEPSLPGDVELIGEDKTRGVFNFYTREDNAWSFFGSSEDFVRSGYDCKDGACVPKISAQARCASCHVGGGLVMKELESPWNNWEGGSNIPTPGLDKLFSTFPTVLGDRGDGVDLEQKVETANGTEWIPHRIDILTQMGTADLLRPLFCSTDMNLHSDGGSATIGSISGGLFADQHWPASGNFFPGVSNATYQQKVKAHKQQISDSEQQNHSLGSDTFFAFTFPQRSDQDLTFVDTLIQRQIVDEELVKDVLAIDFTRPLYSKTRCDLLQFAPKLTPAQLSAKGQSAEAIRTGFLANLQGQSGAAAAALAKNLSTKGDAPAHDAAVQAFLDACTKRPADQFLEDALGIAAHVRNQAKAVKGGNGQGIIEFDETLPESDIPDSPIAFDPVTCQRTLQ